MDYNYHTHTYLCGHAKGIPEQYVIKAIENGIKHMGFSDHFPLSFPDGYESSFRVPVSEARNYISHINSLREKYKSKIDIHVGFEMEYYPERFDEMLKSAKEYGAEYLILGQHYLSPEHPCGIPTVIENASRDALAKYASLIVAAMKTSVFTYVAHPDMFNFRGDISVYRQEMRHICIASRETGVPLELNLLGVRGKRHYPNEAFLQLVGEERSPITFGFDSHDPESAYDGESILKARKFVDKYGLNYIGMPRLVNISK